MMQTRTRAQLVLLSRPWSRRSLSLQFLVGKKTFGPATDLVGLNIWFMDLGIGRISFVPKVESGDVSCHIPGFIDLPLYLFLPSPLIWYHLSSLVSEMGKFQI